MPTANVDYTKANGRQIAHYDQANQEYYVYECTDKLPSYFPPDMKRFVCNDNWITEIPDVLPESLKVLSCSNLRFILPSMAPVLCSVASLARLYRSAKGALLYNRRTGTINRRGNNL